MVCPKESRYKVASVQVTIGLIVSITNTLAVQLELFPMEFTSGDLYQESPTGAASGNRYSTLPLPSATLHRPLHTEDTHEHNNADNRKIMHGIERKRSNRLKRTHERSPNVALMIPHCLPPSTTPALALALIPARDWRAHPVLDSLLGPAPATVRDALTFPG